MNRREWPLLLAIFLDLLGFGMIIPNIQFRAEALGATGPVIGALLASTFVIQFVVSPHWGALSDRIGRKPILLICTLFSAGAMLMYGAASSLIGLLLSRVLAGLGGANVAIAQAYLADATTDEGRIAAMGRVSAAISLGLILGPSISGTLGMSAATIGLVAGGASMMGALVLFLFLPRVPPVEKQDRLKRPVFDVRLLRDYPRLVPLILVLVVAWVSLATLEGTFGRLIKATLGMGDKEFGWILSYESIFSVVVQALLITWVSRRIRERSLLGLAYVAQGIGLVMTPFAPSLAVLFVASTLYALGTGFANPTIYSLCSKIVPMSRQGELFGVMQSARSFGFVVGPVVGGTLFDWKPAAPYLLAGGACLLASVLVLVLKVAPLPETESGSPAASLSNP
ncbi:MAG TPA: MFS transporter [Fimbriimonadaceae bacterium]|nr:MFS transporter [Fimbriimonadaceae bacterium]HRJ34149.1 MFS transporter [Fimbriimonadaceae bacterium]